MNKIKVLPPQEAQKIAAGEVVERPANILKELLENAIDAGATHISVYVEGAGKSCIRIVDNGCGMSYDDIKLCIAPHATSKIQVVEDLVNLMTYGFRGEALASVAAVSRLSITSRDEFSAHAWKIRFEQSDIIEELSIAAEQGTDIEVRDLFYNIPARKKFLKQDETEWNQLQQLVHAISLSHLAISFKLYHNNRLVLQAPAVTNLNDRLAQLWGVSVAKQFLTLQKSPNATIKISGAVTSHQVWRYGKHQIFFFVNGRWVKDIELVKALIKGYNNVLSPGKFPAGVVMLDLDPHSIDVNVHPKKEEVRFTKPQVVSNAVIQAVQQTLKEHSALSTQIAPKGFDLQQQSEDICVSQAIDEKEGIAFIDQAKHVSSFSEDVSIEAEVTASGFVSSQENVIKRIIVDRPGIEFKEIKKSNLPPVFKTLGDVFVDRQVADDPVIEQQKAFTLEKEKTVFTFNGRIVGQILNTYIVVDRSEGMVLVDQHAAHERILYEQMKDRVVARESSLLLFPRILNLSAEELEALGRFDDILTDFGIQCGRMGPQSLAITAVPLGVAHIDLDELLRQVAAIILENDQVEREFIQKKLYEHVHSHLACKRAVKAGDTLTIEQIEKLLLDLTTVEKPYICIHGRPTHWLLEKSQLEKFFQR